MIDLLEDTKIGEVLHLCLCTCEQKMSKIFIVHRLDKDTSGLMVYAKTQKAKDILQKNLIENLNSKLSLFQEALRWKTEIIKLEGDKNSNQALLDSLNGILADQEKDLTTNDDHVKALANQVEVVQKAYDANLAYMSLDLHRNKLVEGQACPCCGSLEHPYSKTKPTVNDTLADELKGIKLNLKKAEAIVGEIKESFASNNAKKESIDSNLLAISTQLDEKTKLLEIELTKLGLAVETTLQNLNDSCNAISASINNYKAHKLWNETKQPLLAYIASLEKYNQDESILNSLTAQRKNIFSSDSIGDYKQEQVLYWNNVNNDIYENDGKTKLDINQNKINDI